MSLHIGNLSSRTRRDDLERVFRRFGRCSIQVRDKYGFAVYDFPASAEKALKTLRGTRICGEALTLSWSKQQPCAPQRFLRGGKSYEPPRIRHYHVKENADRRFGSNVRRDYEMDSKKAADGEVRTKLGSSNLVDDESISHRPYNSKVDPGENDQTSPKDRKNHPVDDRWGEQVVDPTNEKYLENGVDFDRYEPHYSDGKKELDERQRVSPLAGSQERKGKIYKRISQENSQRRLRSIRHTNPSRSWKSDKEPSTPRNRPRGTRKEFRDKKINRRDYGSQDKNHLGRARGPSSSSIHSDYTSSRSCSRPRSRSLRSLSRSRSPSKSKSVDSKRISRSSSLSSSPSRHSETRTFKSRSTSRSMSPNSSLLPVEQLTRLVSSSPNERQKDSKDSAENAFSLVHSKDLSEEETLVRSGTVTFKSENIITSAVENEFETKPAELEQEDMKKDLSENDNEHCHSVSRGSCELLDSYVLQLNIDGHIIDNPHSQNEDFVGERVLAPESNISIRSNASNSARMSSEEMYMVLKHYGLPHPEEKLKDLPVETYFGSARLWPWEMIYYRRFKKGPISAENYSRRVAQNEEFGIVDKYIRGSSGWGELN